MPTIGAKISEKELQAIVEYANQCGEPMNLYHKTLEKLRKHVIFRNV